MNLQCMAAEMLFDRQKQELQKILRPSVKHRWLIVDIMFDETRLKVVVGNCGSRNFPILAAHGGIAWEDGAGFQHQQPLIMPPRALENATSKSLWHGLESMIEPISLACLPCDCAEQLALVLVHDSARSNLHIDKRIVASAPANQLVMTSNCRQHLTALALAPMTITLDIVNPAFNAVNVLRCGSRFAELRAHVRSELRQHLVIVENFRETAQSKHELESVMALLERVYVTGFSQACAAETTNAAEDAAIKQRRRHATQLAHVLRGWVSGHLFHSCGPQCCVRGKEARCAFLTCIV